MTLSAQALGLLFVSLVTLYSPVSNVGANASLTAHLDRADQRRLAFRVLINVLIAMLVFVWSGEALFEILGVSADTVRVAGAIALMSAGLPMMLGTSPAADVEATSELASWSELAVVPMTFPMSMGGSTVAYLVTASSVSANFQDLLAISGVGVGFALVIFATHWFSAPLANKLSPQGRNVLNRIGGIVLVAIAIDAAAAGIRNLLPGLAA